MSLRERLKELGVHAKHALGQHFLLDPALLQRIVRSIPPVSGGHVIEVGPGPGGLSQALLDVTPYDICAVEKDQSFLPLLNDLDAERFQVLFQDALTVDYLSLVPEPRLIVSNLPYNVSVPLLLMWLKDAEHFASLTLMFQKEVAKRIMAKPHTSAYGRLSVMAQWKAKVELVMHLPPGAFSPPPKVSSSVVRLTPRTPQLNPSWKAMETITFSAFGERRKMLRQSLKKIWDNPQEVLERFSIDPQLRAENLSVEEYLKLACYYEEASPKEGL